MNETTDLQCNIKNTYFTLQELEALFHGKQIYIWGAGRHGRCLLIALNSIGISSKAVYVGSISGGGGGGIIGIVTASI
jgi:hypothetical protein